MSNLSRYRVVHFSVLKLECDPPFKELRDIVSVNRYAKVVYLCDSAIKPVVKNLLKVF